MRRFLFGVAFLSAAMLARPCAMAWSEMVKLSGENVILAYDVENGIEHFYRTIRVSGNAKDFGFLVPLPSEPQVGEADPRAWGILQSELDAHRNRGQWAGGGIAGTASTKAAGGIEVLSQQDAAGGEVTVLKADSTKALEEWLKKNKYPTRKELMEWADIYVKQNFVIAAYKFKGFPEGEESKMLRLSFPTTSLFYPYREPKTGTIDQRTWRCFVLGPGPAIADVEGLKPAEVFDLDAREALAQDLGLSPFFFPQGTTVTYYEEFRDEPRPSQDLQFTYTSRPGGGFIWLFGGLAALGIAGFWLASRARSR